MQPFDVWWKGMQQWFAFFYDCLDHPIQTAVCRPFWMWVMIGVLAIGVITLITVIWKFISYKLKYAAALRAEEHRRGVNVELIDSMRWEGENTYSTDVPPEEMQKRIEAALTRRRLGLKPNEPDVV